MKHRHSNTCSLRLLLLLSGIITMSACGDASGPTREQLVAEFPTVERGSTRPENPEILCPFVRMLERSGLLDQTLAEQETLEVSTTELTAAADVFGCAPLECGTVAATVAVGQPGAAGVDIGRLHQAAGIAHDCGLTFAKGATQVTEARRQATLDRLALLADEQGRLTYPDLLEVKLATCAEEDVTITGAGRTETKLIFAYLGGVDNGYITLYDVESFLYASMPAVKTRYEVDLGLLSKVR